MGFKKISSLNWLYLYTRRIPLVNLDCECLCETDAMYPSFPSYIIFKLFVVKIFGEQICYRLTRAGLCFLCHYSHFLYNFWNYIYCRDEQTIGTKLPRLHHININFLSFIISIFWSYINSHNDVWPEINWIIKVFKNVPIIMLNIPWWYKISSTQLHGFIKVGMDAKYCSYYDKFLMWLWKCSTNK